MERDKASIPPASDWAWVKPCSRNHMATLRERAPWWHITTTGASGSSSVWARDEISPMGIRRESAMLAVWNSQGSRTSSKRGALGCWRCFAKASAVISGSNIHSQDILIDGPKTRDYVSWFLDACG